MLKETKKRLQIFLAVFFLPLVSLVSVMVFFSGLSFADSDNGSDSNNIKISFENFTCPTPNEQFFTSLGLPAFTYQYDLSQTNRCEYKNAQQSHYLIIYFWKDYFLSDVRGLTNVGLCQKDPCEIDTKIKGRPALLANINYDNSPVLTSLAIGGLAKDKGVVEFRYDYGYNNQNPPQKSGLATHFLDNQLEALAAKMIS